MAHLVKTLDLKAKTLVQSSVPSSGRREPSPGSCSLSVRRWPKGVVLLFYYYYFSCLHAVVCTSVALAISSGFDVQVFSVRGL